MAVLLTAAVCAQPVRLAWSGPDAQGRLRFTSSGAPDRVHHLEISTDLRRWIELAKTPGGFVAYPDLDPPASEPRFYRIRTGTPGKEDDWKNQIAWRDDPFLSAPGPPWQPSSRWIKFLLLLDRPDRVYFQDSRRYPFHYDFAVARLDRFRGMSREAFDAATLRPEGQQAALGAVLLPPVEGAPEMAIQFAGAEPFPIERVADWFERVRAVLPAPAGAEVFYLPSFEQAGTAQENLDWLAARGIPVRGADSWAAGDQCYATGWALGRLTWAPAADLDQAVREGRLRPEDILAIDATPAEVPPVAGIVTLSPATPNSHVAILAQSFGSPFGWFADPALRAAIPGWDGRMALFRVIEDWSGCRLTLAPLEGEIAPELLAEIDDLRQPLELNLPAWQPYGAISVPADNLGPEDARFVGGKAAHFGLLRRSIPRNSPSPAIAFTLDLWNDYLEQTMPWDGTLREAIAAQLGGFTWPPDMGALSAALAEVRRWIRDVADFTPAQRTAILEALQAAGFTPDRRLRFRSSTNVEDTERFSGAGLYDSFSGCLADELDGDDTGPSLCDPTRPRERGVFRALRKVYASFYNDNAFLERLRHRVDETTVGMGVLVHYSTPDEIELANGVARLTVRRQGNRSVTGELVTQQGALSVANPDSTARPERVTVSDFGSFGPYFEVLEHSSLVPLGGTVFAWDAGYRALYTLLDRAARAYEAAFPGPDTLELDLEYKRVAPGTFQVKQIRRVPSSDPNEELPAYYLAVPNELTVLQEEFGDVFSNHRLKSVWRLHSRHAALRATDLTRSLHPRIEFEFRHGNATNRWDGPVTDLPGYRFVRTNTATEDSWMEGADAEERRLILRTPTPATRRRREGPLVVAADLRIELEASYAAPQPAFGWDPRLTTTRRDFALLGVVPPVSAGSVLQSRTADGPGVHVETRFYWPPAPTGAVAGYTAPLQAWVETRLTGLIDEPLLLRDPFAQTYHPGHHNFYEEFIFEPRLDPATPASALAALEERNIRALVLVLGLDVKAEFFLWTLDNRLVALPAKP